MKKLMSFLLLLTFIIGVSPTTASAATLLPAVETSTVMEDSDGGYYVETITETTSISPFTYSTYSNTTTKTKTKTTQYYNASNSLCWQYSLTGTFRINKGVSATCTNSSAKLSIYNADYSLHNENHSHSGNTATGTIKINYKGIIKSKTISITCSKNGNFS